ncbi:LysR family transcriptional regulator [Roseovarius faecimaris]|uniref:LysR family transcriptional regulator n=1 Tax=Roseovarius faecimaris TaxID=2494550 RepID=A0A6I6IS52_9RHOB|nr:LysR family transcriptional regulator [Roseovarius faecimaris]QGX99575.1 LysR family transcriptional regulator [Roseovarius faecimaris]
MISLRQIKYFITVCQVMKINEAAAQLNVSASAVSSALKDLQEQVGTPLLERHRRGVLPTPAGKRFLQHCNSIMASVTMAMEDTPKNKPKISGKLKLGVTVTIAGYFLSTPLSRFIRANRGIDIEIHEYERETLEEMVISGELDVALMLVSNLHNKAQIKHETLVRSRRRLWVQAGHRLTQKPEITLEDVAREPYIQLLVDEAQTTTQTYWEKHGLVPKTIFETTSVEAIRSQIAIGRGVTILSDMLYRSWSLDAERIESITLANDIPTMDIGIIRSADRKLTGPARVFFDYCKSEVAFRKS